MLLIADRDGHDCLAAGEFYALQRYRVRVEFLVGPGLGQSRGCGSDEDGGAEGQCCDEAAHAVSLYGLGRSTKLCKLTT